MEKILVFTATYNEAGNVERLVSEIFKYLPESQLLVVDDNSPDGTGTILDKLSASNRNLYVIHRTQKLGLGTAHKLAMKYAVRNNFDILVTMDADFSHNPSYLPQLLQRIRDNDFVTGSRYVKDGRSDYGLYRQFVSRTANSLARTLLGLKLKECTTSFRGFRISLLRKLDIDSIRSDGYSFFVESLFYISRLTPRVSEFPIYFENRSQGKSKISTSEIFKSMLKLVELAGVRVFCKKDFSRTKEEHVSDSSCAHCESSFTTQVYPSTTGEKQDESAFRCTSLRHRSHGRIVKCLGCGLVYTDPKIPQDKIIELYSEVEDPTYAENIDARYDTFRYNFSRIKRLLPKEGRLLDVGASCGAFLKIATECGFESIGVEPSKWCVRYANHMLGQRVLEGTIKDLPDTMKDFDIVTLWDVLEHFHDPGTELESINSRMREGGMLVFSTLEINNWFPRVMGSRWPWLMDMHLYYFNESVIRQMLKKSGFRLICTRNYTHIVTLDYLLLKFESLGVWGAKYIRTIIRRSILRHLHIPFRFGDVKMFVAKKESA